jgi:transglutaminase-like putative cysteine protease
MPTSALFYSLRRVQDYRQRLDVAPYYLVMCMLAASTGDSAAGTYLAAMSVLIVGVASATRSRRYGWWQWAAAAGLAALLSTGSVLGLLRAQTYMETAFMYWMNQFPWLPDPNRTMTAIGSIGRLKLSDRIRVRVMPHDDLQFPLLLQEASYDRFSYGTWNATAAEFEALEQRRNGTGWDVATATASQGVRATLSYQHRRELALLPLPRGTRAVESPEIVEIKRNRFGTLLSESPPGALLYNAVVDPRGANEPPPTDADLHVPPEYQDLVSEITAEIGLEGLDAAARSTRIRAFFLDHFSYSLVQSGGFSARVPLAHFLRHTRRGHCEYFASASVLLLRAAGIPARYAVGYAISDYSKLEGAYIGRGRDAHAWALAFIAGQWQVLDATPPVWFDLEDAYASGWQSVQDWLGFVWYRWQRMGAADFDTLGTYLLALVPLLAVILYWRLRTAPTAVRQARRQAARDAHADEIWQPLYVLLAAHGLTPSPGETLRRFIARAEHVLGTSTCLPELLQRYYRVRYAPSAPSGATSELRTLIAQLCADLAVTTRLH